MNPLLLGTAAIVADLIAWRVIAPQHKLTLTAIRLALFVAFSWVLFSHGMSPLEGPALPGQPLRRTACNAPRTRRFNDRRFGGIFQPHESVV